MKIYKITIGIVSILFALNLGAQTKDYSIYVNPRSNLVMAQSGLNIRAKPDLASEKIGKIPFGERLQILHKDHYGYQKLDSIKTQKNKYKIDGLWLKIKYKNLKGFVLSTFLYYPYKYENEHRYSDYVLLMPGGGCTDNIHNINNYNWYGLYTVGDSSSLRKISIDYYNTIDAMINMQIVCKEDQDLKFIIGYKKELKVFEDKVTETNSIPNPYDFRPYPCDTTFQMTKNLIAEYSVEHMRDEYGEFNLFIQKENKGWQKLYAFESGHNFLNQIQFKGDIDSDGIDDYIISFGEKPGFTILFLSSEAKNGDVLKDVACFYTTYCC